MEMEMTAERMAIELVRFNESGEVVLNDRQRKAVFDEIDNLRQECNDFDSEVEVEDGVFVDFDGWAYFEEVFEYGDYWTAPEWYITNRSGSINNMYVLIYDEDTNCYKKYPIESDFFTECEERLCEKD